MLASFFGISDFSGFWAQEFADFQEPFSKSQEICINVRELFITKWLWVYVYIKYTVYKYIYKYIDIEGNMMISSSTQTTGKTVPGNTEFEWVPVRPHCGSMEIIDMVILKSCV